MINVNKSEIPVREIFNRYTEELVVEFHIDSLIHLLKELSSYLKAPFVGVYFFNEWDCTYTSITHRRGQEMSYTLEELKKHPFKKIYEDSNKKCCLIHEEGENIHVLKYMLETLEKPVYFIFQTGHQSFNRNLLQCVCYEMEQFLKIYTMAEVNKRKLDFEKLLNHLSTKIFSTNNRKQVLTYFVNFIEKAYPKITYEILLSQDYQARCELPVRELSFDYEEVRLVDQAFLTGEIKSKEVQDQVEIYIPLKGRQGIYGILKIITKNSQKIPKEELRRMERLATLCGQALENVYLYRHSISLVEDLKLINDATKKLNANSDISALTNIIMEYIQDASHAEEVGIIFFDEEETDKFYVLENSTPYFHKHHDKNFVRFLTDRCKDISRVFSGHFSKQVKDTPFESVMALPMVHTDQMIGCIIIAHQRKYFFSFEAFKLIQSLVQHYTLTISNAILKNKLEEAVITDYLTGLYGRNYLDEMAEKHMATDEQGVLVLFDIDDFKQINDTYGHSVGDQVIVQIADILRKNISEDDIASRWGGEELALYLPNKTIEESYEIAKRILQQAEEKTDPKVTLSCGIAEWRLGINQTIRELFNCTDQALYKAKHLGKNQIVINDCLFL